MLLNLCSALPAPGDGQGSSWGGGESNSRHHPRLPWIRCMASILTYSWVEEVQGLWYDNNQRPFLRMFYKENSSWILVSCLWPFKLMMGYNVASPGSLSDIHMLFLVTRQEEGHFSQGSVVCVALSGGCEGTWQGCRIRPYARAATKRACTGRPALPVRVTGQPPPEGDGHVTPRRAVRAAWDSSHRNKT